jgi:ATP-dependent DNA helicase RecQ
MDDIGSDDAVRRVLREVFGFADFRPGQREVVDALLHGKDVLAVMPTGAGKSLCFQVPALALGGLTVVVSPLVALMSDQVAALRLAGVAAEAINSSRSREDNVATWRRVAAGEVGILYMAPERLMTEPMLAALAKLPLSLIAVDEAHCISQWGPAFRPEYEALSRLKEIFPNTRVAALTATADALTRDDIARKLFQGKVERIVLGFDRPNIRLSVEPKAEWKRQMMSFVQAHPGDCGIVYCLSRKRTEEAAEYLTQNGIHALPYHAGMESAQRAAHQNAFMTEPGLIIVATIAFGMGIDKSDVRYVFHADLPGSVEAYYQELGRAGRDGAPAEAMMLFGLADIRMRRMFIDQEESADERKRREHKRLDTLIGYCESSTCRRRALLTYFGEKIEPCGNCDVCLGTTTTTDGTAEAQIIIETVQRTGQRYGAQHLIDVITGSATEKVTKANHARLPTFGTGKGLRRSDWGTLIRQLVTAEFLSLDIHGYGGLAIADKGWALLRGGESFHYRGDRLTGERASRKAKKTKAAPAAAGPLGAADRFLLGALKELRLRLARERGVPAYVIFADRSLIAMAQRRPKTREEFAEIDGVGAAKLKELAGPFLKLIAETDEPGDA